MNYLPTLLKVPLPNTTIPQVNGESNGEVKEQTPEASEEKEFWVGKNTLKKWRAFAREDLDQKMRNEAVRYLGKLNIPKILFYPVRGVYFLWPNSCN